MRTSGFHADDTIWHQRLGHPSCVTLKNCIEADVFAAGALLRPDGTENARDVIFYERLFLGQIREDEQANANRVYANNGHSYASTEDEAAAAILEQDPRGEFTRGGHHDVDEDSPGGGAGAAGGCGSRSGRGVAPPAPLELESDDDDVQEVIPQSRHDGTVSTPPPAVKGRRILYYKWVFRVKTAADGTIERFKVRWVIRGYDQRHGIDFDQTFAPVSRAIALNNAPPPPSLHLAPLQRRAASDAAGRGRSSGLPSLSSSPLRTSLCASRPRLPVRPALGECHASGPRGSGGAQPGEECLWGAQQAEGEKEGARVRGGRRGVVVVRAGGGGAGDGGAEAGQDNDGLDAVLAKVVWAGFGLYMLWLFVLPYAPGDPAWRISEGTVQEVRDLSLNFFYILPAFNAGEPSAPVSLQRRGHSCAGGTAAAPCQSHFSLPTPTHPSSLSSPSLPPSLFLSSLTFALTLSVPIFPRSSSGVLFLCLLPLRAFQSVAPASTTCNQWHHTTISTALSLYAIVRTSSTRTPHYIRPLHPALIPTSTSWPVGPPRCTGLPPKPVHPSPFPRAVSGHQVAEALFNVVNAWSLLFGPLLLADPRRTRVGTNLPALWLAQMFLTNGALQGHVHQLLGGGG
ncbi:unnamed protein product [Closterium sp. NIES-54]